MEVLPAEIWSKIYEYLYFDESIKWLFISRSVSKFTKYHIMNDINNIPYYYFRNKLQENFMTFMCKLSKTNKAITYY